MTSTFYKSLVVQITACIQFDVETYTLISHSQFLYTTSIRNCIHNNYGFTIVFAVFVL